MAQRERLDQERRNPPPGLPWVSRDTIAKMTGMSVRSVISATEDAVRSGWLIDLWIANTVRYRLDEVLVWLASSADDELLSKLRAWQESSTNEELLSKLKAWQIANGL